MSSGWRAKLLGGVAGKTNARILLFIGCDGRCAREEARRHHQTPPPPPFSHPLPLAAHCGVRSCVRDFEDVRTYDEGRCVVRSSDRVNRFERVLAPVSPRSSVVSSTESVGRDRSFFFSSGSSLGARCRRIAKRQPRWWRATVAVGSRAACDERVTGNRRLSRGRRKTGEGATRWPRSRPRSPSPGC